MATRSLDLNSRVHNGGDDTFDSFGAVPSLDGQIARNQRPGTVPGSAGPMGKHGGVEKDTPTPASPTNGEFPRKA